MLKITFSIFPGRRKQLVGIFLTTFGKQIFSSDKRKWFDAEKQAAIALVKEFSRQIKDTSYSIGAYGSTAQVNIPFSPPIIDNKLTKDIKDIQDPRGTPNVYQALNEVEKSMFKASNKADKVLVLFIEEKLTNDQRIMQKAKTLRDEQDVRIIAVLAGSKVSDENINGLIGNNGKLIIMKQPEKSTDIAPVISSLNNKGN